MITLDLNGDGRARDCVYRKPAVSENPKDPTHGLNGLVRAGDARDNTFFEAIAPVIVWSVGPDRHLDDRQKADQGVNRDNILSWKR